MSGAPSPRHLKRPSIGQTRPRRAAGGLYRSAENERTGLGGVSVASAEDAMVAAVRMAYDIADNQIARSKRLADRLKGAADRATGADPDASGYKSGQDAVDAAGRLVNNAMLSGMSWVEALLAADSGLAPRLASAQLKAVKSVIFGRGEAGAEPEGPAERVEVPSSSPPPRPEPETPRVRIVLPKEKRRAVRLVRWEVEKLTSKRPVSFRFVGRSKQREDYELELTGSLKPPTNEESRPTLIMELTPLTAPSGVWRAAVCDSRDEQVGIIEIEI